MRLRTLAVLQAAAAAAIFVPQAAATRQTATFVSTVPEGSVTPQQFLGPNERLSVDAGPAIRRALATHQPVRFPPGDYVVGPDPNATPKLKVRTYSLLIPDGAHLIFERGARIVQAPGARSWLRTISFQDASNVIVEGELWVDANARRVSASNSEQMHGVFLWNTSNTVIDSIRSENARGDNVLIGGDNNSPGTHDVRIGAIYAKTAGRKNLVLHSVRDVHIGRAILDNRDGGAKLYGGRPTRTDGHSLDVEPDKFNGTVENSAFIDSVETYGSGNDFSAGKTALEASRYRVEVGTFISHIFPRAGVPPWIQYAVTIIVGDLQIDGASGDTPSEIRYAARLSAKQLKLTGSNSTKPLLWIAQAQGHVPDVRIGAERVRNARGEGIRRGGRAP